MSRPHYTHKDANHHILRDFMRTFCGGYEEHKDGRTIAYTANFRGRKFTAYDTANIGGVFADWLLECVSTQQFMWVEVKTEGTRNQDGEFRPGTFKEGEEWLRENSSSWIVAVTDEDVNAIFELLL